MAHRPSWLKRVTNAARNEALFPVTDLDLFLHKKVSSLRTLTHADQSCHGTYGVGALSLWSRCQICHPKVPRSANPYRGVTVEQAGVLAAFNLSNALLRAALAGLGAGRRALV